MKTDIALNSILIAINIINAIKNDDIALMRQATEQANTFVDINNESADIAEIPLIDLYNDFGRNESLLYFIENITFFLPQIDAVKMIMALHDFNTKTDEEIYNFLTSELEERKEYLNLEESFYYQLLFKLGVKIKNYDILSALKPYITTYLED